MARGRKPKEPEERFQLEEPDEDVLGGSLEDGEPVVREVLDDKGGVVEVLPEEREGDDADDPMGDEVRVQPGMDAYRGTDGEDKIPGINLDGIFDPTVGIDGKEPEEEERAGGGDRVPAYRQTGDVAEGDRFGGTTEHQLIMQLMSKFSEDVRVDVEVWECIDEVPSVPRGLLKNRLASFVSRPANYIPYGGTFSLEFYSSRTHKPLHNRSLIVTLPGDPPPGDWRVEQMMTPEKIAELVAVTLAKMQGGAAGVPGSIYKDEKEYLRHQLDEEKKLREELRRELQETKLALVKIEAGGGSNGGRESMSDMMKGIAALLEATRPKEAPPAPTEPAWATALLQSLIDAKSPKGQEDAYIRHVAFQNSMMDSMKKWIEIKEEHGPGASKKEPEWKPLLDVAQNAINAYKEKNRSDGDARREAQRRQQEPAQEPQQGGGGQEQARQEPSAPAGGKNPLLAMLEAVRERMRRRDPPGEVVTDILSAVNATERFKFHEGNEMLAEMYRLAISRPAKAIAELSTGLGLSPTNEEDVGYVARIATGWRRVLKGAGRKLEEDDPTSGMQTQGPESAPGPAQEGPKEPEQAATAPEPEKAQDAATGPDPGKPDDGAGGGTPAAAPN